MPRKKGHKKLEETETEAPKQSAPPKPKPDSDEELRYFQVTLKGNNPEGKNVVHGAEKVWLTKKQAKAAGHVWHDEPHLG